MARLDPGAPRIRFLRDPWWRGLAAQIVLCTALVLLAYGAIHNAAENLARAKIASQSAITPPRDPEMRPRG